MSTPLNIFYAKVLQYFNYAGIKVINVHAQASFIFSATIYFYLLEVIRISGMEFNLITKVSILLTGPIMHLLTYKHYNKETSEKELYAVLARQPKEYKVIVNVLTALFVLPMIVFFTISVFN